MVDVETGLVVLVVDGIEVEVIVEGVLVLGASAKYPAEAMITMITITTTMITALPIAALNFLI
jgi:hypothetical protein